MKSLIKLKIYRIVFLIIIFDLLLSKKIGNNFKSFTDDEIVATITSDNEEELLKAVSQLNQNGGTIYIDTPVVSLSRYIKIIIDGPLPGGIIGIKQANGEYPRIDFTKGNAVIAPPSGLVIYGSNKFIEYVIIENVPDAGVSIMGENNILDHIISRYNFGSGFRIYGNFNTLNYCYAYRNCDIRSFDSIADGFYISGEVNNVFRYCFAWENANSGFNYVRPFNSSELSYLHSGSWNNGNANVFTGYYDYNNGNPLDKKLWTIKEIMATDPNFVSNYYNKKYNIDNAKIKGVFVKEWITKTQPNLAGNGFTFGNLNSSQSIEVKRNALYCVSFDHKDGGFMDNYNHRYNAFMTNCVAFNNGINYRLPYTFSRWTDNWSWGSKNKDQLNNGITTKIPSNINTAEKSIYSVRDVIIKAVNANMFPDNINFDNAIIKLN